ncbi:hypothetical protein [Nostoc sp. FACHB-110]|uniref:hypothetical protein n=1 Tax=Nostoc sp. FACHB-110 TaxID=2692834 RepID=UPI001A7E9466|nr:hypothetical protein [Nostoc sp. FACHB-110]
MLQVGGAAQRTGSSARAKRPATAISTQHCVGKLKIGILLRARNLNKDNLYSYGIDAPH